MRSPEPLGGDRNAPRDPLEALRDGDPAPFEAYVRQRGRDLVLFFRRQGAGRAEAEDLSQDVFLKLYRHADRYRANERFAAYILRIARNVWIDSRRRRAVRPAAAAGDGPAGEREEGLDGALGDRQQDPGPQPGEHAAVADEAGRLRVALAELSEAHRLVFEFGVLRELSYPEIADLLGIPIGTVKSRMFHAVRKLREAVEGDA